ELAPFIEEAFSREAPLLIAALGRGGNDATTFGAGLRADLEQIAAFPLQDGAGGRIETLDLRGPADLYGIRVALTAAHQMADKLELQSLASYYELPSESEYRDFRSRLLALLGEAGKGADPLRQMVLMPVDCPGVGRKRAGLKLRCGGLDAAAFPSP